MIERIAGYVLSQKGDLARVRLEAVAVCLSHGDKAARGAAERWLAAPAAERAATQGRRQQLLLRAEIDLLSSRGIEALSREEAAFLCAVCELALARRNENQRLCDLLDGRAADLKRWRDRVSPSHGVNMLETRVRVLFTEQLAGSPRRQAPLFAGQPRPGPGPTLEAAGPLSIIGGIPDDCTVIVTGGPCSVDGYVLGRLGVADGCDISENVAGSVVASRGNVRCRNVIEKAFIVAKTGSVRFVQAMNPATVFAGDTVSASEAISRGLFFGARIEAGRAIRGGTLHASRLVVSEQFAPADKHPLNIVLRSAISFEEYGEQLGPEALHLKSRAARLRRQLTHLGNMVRAAQAEAEHAASTAVLRAFSNLRLIGVLEERARAERRVAVLNRLIAALQELYAGAEEALAAGEQLPDDAEDALVLGDVERELEELARDGCSESTLQEREEVRALYDRLGWMRDDRGALLGTLGELRERMEVWIVERQELNAQLHRLNGEINRALPEAGLAAVAARAEENREPSLAALQRKIMTLKNNPPTPEIQRRLQTPLVQVMINMMQRRIQRLNELGASIRTCKAQLAGVAAELQGKYGLGEKAEVEIVPARAEGRFAAGVRIYRDAYLLDEPKPAPGAVVRAPDSGDRRLAYVRGLASIFTP